MQENWEHVQILKMKPAVKSVQNSSFDFSYVVEKEWPNLTQLHLCTNIHNKPIIKLNNII